MDLNIYNASSTAATASDSLFLRKLESSAKCYLNLCRAVTSIGGNLLLRHICIRRTREAKKKVSIDTISIT